MFLSRSVMQVWRMAHEPVRGILLMGTRPMVSIHQQIDLSRRVLPSYRCTLASTKSYMLRSQSLTSCLPAGAQRLLPNLDSQWSQPASACLSRGSNSQPASSCRHATVGCIMVQQCCCYQVRPLLSSHSSFAQAEAAVSSQLQRARAQEYPAQTGCQQF